MRGSFDLSLYLVTDRALAGRRGVAATVQAAAAGGVTMVQLRDPEGKTRALLEAARRLVALLRPLGIPLIVNDRADVAVAADADGVHVGQADMPAREARALVGPDRILGLSITGTADLAADLDGVDYLGVGPVFATLTKPDAAPPLGLDGLGEIVQRTRLPIVAIGGISTANAAATIAAGADGLSVVSAIMASPDPEAAARELASVVTATRHRAQKRD
jgi:thiamine-phosphate pyrophosphorylase